VWCPSWSANFAIQDRSTSWLRPGRGATHPPVQPLVFPLPPLPTAITFRAPPAQPGLRHVWWNMEEVGTNFRRTACSRCQQPEHGCPHGSADEIMEGAAQQRMPLLLGRVAGGGGVLDRLGWPLGVQASTGSVPGNVLKPMEWDWRGKSRDDALTYLQGAASHSLACAQSAKRMRGRSMAWAVAFYLGACCCRQAGGHLCDPVVRQKLCCPQHGQDRPEPVPHAHRPVGPGCVPKTHPPSCGLGRTHLDSLGWGRVLALGWC
jgi:hypothetical protein